jgi:hypothetical protein
MPWLSQRQDKFAPCRSVVVPGCKSPKHGSIGAFLRLLTQRPWRSPIRQLGRRSPINFLQIASFTWEIAVAIAFFLLKARAFDTNFDIFEGQNVCVLFVFINILGRLFTLQK